MAGLSIPILLGIIGAVFAVAAYRSVQRGGARFYQLERDAILRRAGFYQLASLVTFAASVGLLVYTQAFVPVEDDGFVEDGAADSAEVAPATPTPPAQVIVVEDQPPTIAIEPSPTPDANAPTLTPTPIIRRAEVTGTGGSGAYLREGASTLATDLQVLDEGTLVTLIDDEIIEAEGFNWVRVRTLGGTEGFVVDLYLEEFQR